MKKYFPKRSRREVIKNPEAQPLKAAGPSPAMTAVLLPAAFGANSVAALAARRSASDTVATVYLGRTYVFNGVAPESYARLGTIRGFAMTGKLVEDFPVKTQPDPIANTLPAGMDNCVHQAKGMQVQIAGVDRILPDVCDFDALADQTLLFCGREIMSVAEATMTAPGAYTMTVLRGRFGSGFEDHGAGDAVWISRARLPVLQHPFFSAGNVARFKITLGQQSLAEAQPFEIKL